MNMNELAFKLLFLLTVNMNTAVCQNMNSKHFVAVKGSDINLCAVASQSQLKTTRSVTECGSFCSKSTGCIGFNFYDNRTCSLITLSSYYYFYPVASCKAFMDVDYYSTDGVKLNGCPPGFDYMNGGCFKVIFQPFDWSSTGEVCRWLLPGAHLVAITSAARQNATESYLQQQYQKNESQICDINAGYSNSGKSVWTSGQTQDPNQCEPKTPFVWKTLGSLELPFSYRNFYSGQPSCDRHQQHCLLVMEGMSYQWNDFYCGQPFCPLCEF